MKPVDLISLSSPIITHPTLVDGSLLQPEMCVASSMKRASHLSLTPAVLGGWVIILRFRPEVGARRASPRGRPPPSMSAPR